ncbi:uncharacterized protein N0V96_004988 [Colletotrichum fioriniae]|uniref:uncharacterized protein n=1 Tax=Colletotrichum fioriniae TaxID=710243 RepID=UPI0032DA8EE8|nr:hypothetical protein N0V96_004988 [Colletotrichum fioriniae]
MISPLSQAPTIVPAQESTNDANAISEPGPAPYSRREHSIDDGVNEDVVVSGNIAHTSAAEPALRDLLHRVRRLEDASPDTARRRRSEIPQQMMGKDTDSRVVLKKSRVWRWSDWMGEASEPTFRAEYQRFWDDPASVKNDLRLKILLVIAIGSSLHDPEDVEPGFKRLADQWIYAAQAWLSGPLEKDRLGINGVQIHCLTILARHILSIGGDLVWISTGTLLHTAMQIGLHRDPSHLSSMSTLQAEIRRRLWSTILELVIQSSLDAAMPPRISFDEFDAQPPANINDDELEESQSELRSHPRSTYTDMSLHLQLRDSLLSRLRVVQLLNGIHHELSYHVALELSSEITHACRTNIHFVRQHERSGVSVFHQNLLDFLVRRFLIPLHCPFASQAQTNPLFQYSTKVTLDATITIISPVPDDKFSRLFRIAGGMFREGYRYALATVSHEYIAQAETQHRDGTLQRNVQQREFLKKTMLELIEIAAERVQYGGETNIKGHMFLKMIVAQIEAMEMGIPGDLEIAKSAKEMLQFDCN